MQGGGCRDGGEQAAAGTGRLQRTVTTSPLPPGGSGPGGPSVFCPPDRRSFSVPPTLSPFAGTAGSFQGPFRGEGFDGRAGAVVDLQRLLPRGGRERCHPPAIGGDRRGRPRIVRRDLIPRAQAVYRATKKTRRQPAFVRTVPPPAAGRGRNEGAIGIGPCSSWAWSFLGRFSPATGPPSPSGLVFSGEDLSGTGGRGCGGASIFS